MNGKRFHYFRDRRSLCGRWMFAGYLQSDEGPRRPEDCASCGRKLEEENK